MQAMLERDRRYKLGTAGPRLEIDDAYIGGERTGEGTGRGRRGHTPFIVAIETSDDGRPLHARLQVVRGFRAGETRRLCSGVEAGTTILSDGGQWFRCITEQPGIVHQRHFTGSDRKSARHPAFRWASHPSPDRRQTSATLSRRLRLALQPPLCFKNHPRAARRRRNDHPANALPPPQIS
jgi:ISXO2-like transposase domain